MIGKSIFRIALVGFLLFMIAVELLAQQVSDDRFDYPLPRPTYAEVSGPLILFDEAHHNGSTLRGTYAAFGKLLRKDGYRLVRGHEQISPEILQGVDIFVSVNAMHDPEHWDLPTGSAFSAQEIDALCDWVASGGSLFLITDHMPCGGSVAALAARFGINVINGFALRLDGQRELFSKGNNTLLTNAITSVPGREVDSIMCWGGTGFVVPPNAEIISRLGVDYRVYLPQRASQIKWPLADSIPSLSGMGLVNGAYLCFGKGRLVIFGDAAPFSAQLQGIKSEKRGMNHPAVSQNAQLLLNIMHWLDGKL